MHVSTYEITFPFSDDKHVLVNGLYGAIDIVSPEEAELISQAKNDSSLPEGLNSSRLEMLIERGHIVSDLNQETQDMRIISRLHTLLMGRGAASIVLMPTYDCNLRCVYCYEQHRLSRGHEWLEHTMTASVLDDIFMQVKDFKARGYSVKHCTLYGGEPLLVRNKSLIRDICERCRENDLTISAVTNGCELEHFIDIIEEFKFSMIQITVDGLKDIHDSQRPFAGGKGSYDKIMNNIGLALEHGMYVIDPYGQIYPCWDVVGKDGEEIGFVEGRKFMYNFNIAKWHTRTSDRMPECSSCPFLMLCGGGCARAGIKALMKATCDDFQKRFEFVAPIVIQKAINGDYAAKTEPHNEDDVSKDKGEGILSSSKVKSKYIDDPSCLSLSVNEFLRELNPDERNILMTTNSEREAADILKAHTVM